MDVKVLNSSPKEISLSIKESDIGTLYVVQHELLHNSEIDFAGVMVKHPLTKECWMRVSTRGLEPVAAVTRAADSAIKSVRTLGELLRSKIRED